MTSTLTPADTQTDTTTCPLVAEDFICPMTQTTTCTTNEGQQRQCSAC